MSSQHSSWALSTLSAETVLAVQPISCLFLTLNCKFLIIPNPLIKVFWFHNADRYSTLVDRLSGRCGPRNRVVRHVAKSTERCLVAKAHWFVEEGGTYFVSHWFVGELASFDQPWKINNSCLVSIHSRTACNKFNVTSSCFSFHFFFKGYTSFEIVWGYSNKWRMHFQILKGFTCMKMSSRGILTFVHRYGWSKG